MEVLLLTLNKAPFDTAMIGMKNREYRVDKASNWIRNRLIDKKTGLDRKYDFVKFQNGYGATKPYFICRFKGYEIAKKNYSVKYPNGFQVDVKKGDFRILFGKVLKVGNVLSKEMF